MIDDKKIEEAAINKCGFISSEGGVGMGILVLTLTMILDITVQFGMDRTESVWYVPISIFVFILSVITLVVAFLGLMPLIV